MFNTVLQYRRMQQDDETSVKILSHFYLILLVNATIEALGLAMCLCESFAELGWPRSSLRKLQVSHLPLVSKQVPTFTTSMTG